MVLNGYRVFVEFTAERVVFVCLLYSTLEKQLHDLCEQIVNKLLSVLK